MKQIIRFFCVATLILAMLLLAACTPAGQDPTPPKYSFRVGDTEIVIDGDFAPIREALGEARQYSESPSCLFEGLDKVYVYSGVKIQTYPDGEGEYVYSIELTDDSLSTPEGLTIASTREAVETAMGEGGETDANGNISYTDKARGHKLIFHMKSDRVTNIQYIKIVEE